MIIGGVSLAQQFGYMDQLPDSAWRWVFALISLVALVSYITSGLKEWGWLFPAGFFGGLAATIALATNQVDSAAVGSPIFLGLFIPFAPKTFRLSVIHGSRFSQWWIGHLEKVDARSITT